MPRGLLPCLPARPPDRLTDEEAEAVFGIRTEPHRFVLRLLLGTGLRWGEALNARADHVDKNGVLIVGKTKSRKVRRLPLAGELLHEARTHVATLVPFVNPTSFARYVRRHSGVERFDVHQTRHTYACQWLERGGGLHALQLILGHADIRTTMRYARLTDAHVRAEVERLDTAAGMR